MKIFTFALSVFALLSPAFAQEKTDQDVPANHCEFYVDGLGIGEVSYTWSRSKWLDTYVKVDPKLIKKIETVGMRVAYLTDGNMETEISEIKIGKLVPNTNNVFMMRFDLLSTKYDHERGRADYQENTLQTFSYFVTLKEEGTRLIYPEKTFTLEKVYAPFKIWSEPLGRGSMHYVDNNSDSPLFYQKNRCEKEYR